MKSKIISAVLYISIIVLIVGFAVLGVMIYLDATSDNQKQEAYTLSSIATEEPEDKSSDESDESINETIRSVIESMTEENQNETESEIVEEDESISKYFYDQLSDYEKIIYNALKDSKSYLKQGNYQIQLGDSFSDLLSEEDGVTTLGESYQAAVEAFLHDNPDVFYLDVSKMYLNIETTTKLFSTTYNVYITPGSYTSYLSSDFSSTEQVESAINAIEEVKNYVVSKLTGSDYEKIKAIHNYLINTIDYDSSYSATGTYGIYGALVGKTCVCEGYAKAFKYLCNSVNIECEIMQGTATNSSQTTENHAWNCVKLNGVWYGVDATWDDPVITGNSTSISNTVRTRYFLKGSTTFNRDHVLEYQFSDGGKIFSYPTLSETDY